METIKLTARARTGTGKSYTRKTRVAGWVPAAYFGFGIDPINVEVDSKEFARIVSTKQHNKLVELVGEGIPADTKVLIREVQSDPVRNDYYYHVDFQNVDASRPVKTRVFLELTGESEQVKLGGILNQAAYEIEVSGMVDDIPASVQVDAAILDNNGTALAGDIVLDDKITLLTSPARVIARILGKAKSADAE